MTTYQDKAELTAANTFVQGQENVYAAVDGRITRALSNGIDTAMSLLRATQSLSFEGTSPPTLAWGSNNLVISSNPLVLRFTYRDPETGAAVSRSISLAAGTYGFGSNAILLIQLPFSGNLALNSASSELKYFASDAAVTTFLNSDRASNGALSMQRYVQVARKEGGALDIIGKVRIPDGRTLSGMVTDSAYALDSTFDDLIKTVNQDRNLRMWGDALFTFSVPASTNVAVDLDSGDLFLGIADRVIGSIEVDAVTLTDAAPWLAVTLTRDESAGDTPTLTAAASSGEYDPEADGDEVFFLARKVTGGTAVTWCTYAVWQADAEERVAGPFPASQQDLISSQVLKGRVLWVDASASSHPADPDPALTSATEDFMVVTGPSGWRASGLGLASWRLASASIYALDNDTVYTLDVSRLRLLADSGRSSMLSADYIDAFEDIYLGEASLDDRISSIEDDVSSLDSTKADTSYVDAADTTLQDNIDTVSTDLSTLEGRSVLEEAGATALSSLVIGHPAMIHLAPAGPCIPGYGVDGLEVTGGISAIVCDGEYIWYARYANPYTITRVHAHDLSSDTWSRNPINRVTQMACIGGNLYYVDGTDVVCANRTTAATTVATLAVGAPVEALYLRKTKVLIASGQVLYRHAATLGASEASYDAGTDLSAVAINGVAGNDFCIALAMEAAAMSWGLAYLDDDLALLAQDSSLNYALVTSDGRTFYTARGDGLVEAWPAAPGNLSAPDEVDRLWVTDVSGASAGESLVDILSNGVDVICLCESQRMVGLDCKSGGVSWAADVSALGSSTQEGEPTLLGVDAYGIVTAGLGSGDHLVRRLDGIGPRVARRLGAGVSKGPLHHLLELQRR